MLESEMVSIEIAGENAVFEVIGWDKLWSLRSRLEIPLSHIKQAYVDPAPAMGWFDGMKVAGTALPHIFRAGIFYQEGGLVFWDVHNPEKTIVVELDHESFSKLIVEVEEPEAAARLLNEVVRREK
jgi:hypothetical protein